MLKKIIFCLFFIVLIVTQDSLGMYSDKEEESNSIAGSISYVAMQGYKWWQIRSNKRLLQADEYALHRACAEGNLKKVNILLAVGASIDLKDDGGFTPLHVASLNGHKKIVENLTERGADVDIKRDTGATPLYVAACNGHEEIVQYLINHGAHVNVRLKDGATPLHIAAYNGHIEVIKILVNYGTDINTRFGVDGSTALCMASQQERKEIVGFLINHGSSIDISSNANATSFHSVACKNRGDIAKILLCKSYFYPKLEPILNQSRVKLQKLCLISLLNNLNDYDEKSLHTILTYFAQHLVLQRNTNDTKENTIDFLVDQAPLTLQQKLIQFWRNENSKESKGKEENFIKTLCERHLAKIQSVLEKKIQGIKDFEDMTARDVAHKKGHNNLVTLFDRVSNARSFDQLDKESQQSIRTTIENKLAINRRQID